MTKGGVLGRGEESSKFLFMFALSTHLSWVTYTLYLRLFKFKWSTLKGPWNAFFKPPYLLWIYSQHVKEKKSKRSYDNGHKAKLSVREISKYMQKESYSQLEIECLEMPHFALPWHHSVFRSQWHFQQQCSCQFSLQVALCLMSCIATKRHCTYNHNSFVVCSFIQSCLPHPSAPFKIFFMNRIYFL